MRKTAGDVPSTSSINAELSLVYECAHTFLVNRLPILIISKTSPGIHPQSIIDDQADTLEEA